MKIHYLDSKNYLFGNKGAVWSNQIHIAESGSSTTRCGVPMLSSNWAAINELDENHGLCPECEKSYNQSKS